MHTEHIIKLSLQAEQLNIPSGVITLVTAKDKEHLTLKTIPHVLFTSIYHSLSQKVCDMERITNAEQEGVNNFL
jgi:hypothetical protein